MIISAFTVLMLTVLNKTLKSIAITTAVNVDHVRTDLQMTALTIADNVEKVRKDLKDAGLVAAINVENVRKDLKNTGLAAAINVENVRTDLKDQYSTKAQETREKITAENANVLALIEMKKTLAQTLARSDTTAQNPDEPA